MGRPAHPWFRASRNRWYVKWKGKLMDLGADKAAAFAKFAAFVSGAAESLGLKIAPQTASQSSRAGTVAELITVYAGTLDVSPKTLTDYRDRLAWLSRHFGTLTADRLTADDIQGQARAAGWTPNTRRQTLAVVQGFLRWCGLKYIKLKYPAAQSRGDEMVMTPDEFARILAHAPGDCHPLFRFLWEVGCRPGEACGLTAEVVSWDAGTASLKAHKTARKGKSRVLYLTAEALAILAAQRAKYGSGHLFRGPLGRPLTSVRAGVAFGECAKRAGLPGRILYSTRHSFATRMLRAGRSTSVVAKLMGHSNTAMIDRCYGHLSADAQWLRGQARLDGAA